MKNELCWCLNQVGTEKATVYYGKKYKTSYLQFS